MTIPKDFFFRCRLKCAQRPLLTWGMAFCLAAGVGAVQLKLLTPLSEELGLLAAKHEALPNIEPIQPPAVVRSSRDPVGETLALFPAENQAPVIWGRIETLAEKHHILLPAQTFEWQEENDLPLISMTLPLTIKVNEADLRQFLLEAKSSIPSLAVQKMNLKRSRTLDRQLDVDLQLTIYFQKSA